MGFEGSKDSERRLHQLGLQHLPQGHIDLGPGMEGVLDVTASCQLRGG